jgi:putative mycofactocin binding protein MftB
VSIDLDAPYRLDERVALRPEPFGALAYHFGNRRLTFLRSPDIVAVLEGLDGSPTVADALRGASIDEARWPSFAKALDSLAGSDMIHRRSR